MTPPHEDLSRASRVEGIVFDVDGVLTDGTLYYGRDGESLKAFSARDGLGLALLRDLGYRMGAISGRRSPVVEQRLRELGMDHVDMGRMDKGHAVQELADKWGLELEQLAAIGDDLVDWAMLRKVGFSAAPADADPRLLERVDRPLTAAGGRGAVRELAEIVLRARGEWAAIAARFELEERK